MAKNNELVKWHGNLGGIVGYKTRGQHYMRTAGCTHHDANSEAQMEVRAKFRFVTQLIHKMGSVYKYGYQNYNTTKTPRNNFFSQLYNEAVTGNRTDGYVVDYENVLVSRGLLLPTYSMTCSVLGAQHKVSFSWTDNAGQGDARGDDKIFCHLYNAGKGVGMLSVGVAERSAEAAQVEYPAAWAGDTVYVYVGWKKADGTDCSDSQMVTFFVAE